MGRKQVFNPFLPAWEYIPDGEPHVFGDRLYLFGSHDTEGGSRYCAEGNYVCWSAPVEDLSDWRYEGVIFDARQNPGYAEGHENDLYAPDVVQGNDGRYYLYYNMVGHDHHTGFDMIHVAVSDTPAGRYEYLGFVKNPDGSVYQSYLDADPAVINDDGVIRLYHGWSFSMVAAAAHNEGRTQQQKLQNAPAPDPGAMKKMLYKMLFGRTEEDTKDLKYPLMGANTVTLADDMLTVTSQVSRIVPGQFDTPRESSFFGHSFYEAASIRKINGLYYFIYSSENSHELCYATSLYPDRDFIYRGILQSNGDVGLHGRKDGDRLNMTANNHGSLECVNGQWYIFYHRQTHNSSYSRQACAEPVTVEEDGSIRQAECTSCGLNGGPLRANGEYPAIIACNLTNGHMPHITNRIGGFDIPFITHSGEERYITNMKNGCMAAWKYFDFTGAVRLTVTLRGAAGSLSVQIGAGTEEKLHLAGGTDWYEVSGKLTHQGVAALHLTYCGDGAIDISSIRWEESL